MEEKKEDVTEDIKEEVKKEIEETTEDIKEANEQEDNFVKHSLERIRKDEMLPLFRKVEYDEKTIEELPLKGMKQVKGRHLQRAADLMREEGRLFDYSTTAVYDSAEFAIAVYRVVTGVQIELINELYSVDYFNLVNMCKRFLVITG